MDAEKKVLDHSGVKMAYFVSGPSDGAPIVLMHGWGCNHTTVQSIEQTLSSKFRVYNVDFPGFGESTEPQGEPVWGVEEYAQLIEQLLRHENIERPTLIGHSFGGRVGIVMASRNNIDKLILVDAAGVKPRHSLAWYCKVYSYKLSKWFIRLTHSHERAEEIIAQRSAGKGSADYRAASQAMKRVFVKVVNEDLCDLMPKIKAPTLLIWGENDTATPLADARKMNKLIAGSGLVSFPGCGHYSFLDNPFQFKAVLQSFMNS